MWNWIWKRTELYINNVHSLSMYVLDQDAVEFKLNFDGVKDYVGMHISVILRTF